MARGCGYPGCRKRGHSRPRFWNLYGTTYEGGVYNHGTVYELSPGQNGKWTEKILYSFKGLKDGANPVAGIVFDAAGNIYGTTALGGSTKGQGTVFELATLGNSNYVHTILWTFSGTDVANPYASLILDSAGKHLCGTTNAGGSSNVGGWDSTAASNLGISAARSALRNHSHSLAFFLSSIITFRRARLIRVW
jgi:uncharacterized repeat protein (TIGR03803 family)